MARPDLSRLKPLVPLSRSSGTELSGIEPSGIEPSGTEPSDARPPRTTAQQVRAPVMSTRPGPSDPVVTAALDPLLAALPEPESGYRALASAFLCRAVGALSGQVAAATLYSYLEPAMDCEPVVMDSAWQEQVFGDGEVDGWIAHIRERCAPILSAGLAAYAHAVMHEVFPDPEGGASDFPAKLQEIAGWLDHFGLCAALDSKIDLHSLEKLGSRLCVRFLCNTVLLPRLRIEPDAFPEPRPTAESIAEQLSDAFEVHATAFQQRLMRISERALGTARRDKLHQMLRAADLQGWLDEHATQIGLLEARRQDFLRIADTCLMAPLSDWPLSFPLTCLLKTFQSYPQTLEQHVNQRELQDIDADDHPPMKGDAKSLTQQQAELNLQRQLWMADLMFVRRELLTIARLDPAGKAYLHQQLTQLALAEYRPRIGAINLRTVLRLASRQQASIVELDEPDEPDQPDELDQ